MRICPACSREYGDEHDNCRDDGIGLVHLDTGTSDRAQDLIGKVVDGRYRIERIVGRGGMGTVYACRHVVVGKAFAMKVLRSGIERSEEVLQRFIREAQAANAVRSRHICEMSDFGQLESGAFYVVMELLQGMSLTRALREKRLKRRDIKHVFIQISETLQKAHDVNIIHRDLKPDNVVLVHDDNDPFFVKLVDFGIAKIMESKASNLTETGVILGTPYYMSPEQARGDKIDHRSDIYALGVMMYRAFTGKLPFVADTAMGVLTRHLTEKPELPSLITEMDAPTERLILRCLEKRPIDRFQAMASVSDALRSLDDVLTPRFVNHPTVDERSDPLSARPDLGPRPVVTPTRVATPQAQANRAGGRAPGMLRPNIGPASVPPPLPNRPTSQPPLPPPMPVPRMASSRASAAPAPAPPAPAPPAPAPPAAAPTPVGPAGSGPQQAIPAAHPSHSGDVPAVPATTSEPIPGLITPSDGLPGHFQGEAPTNRGVVSTRLPSVTPPRRARRLALWVAAAAAMMVLGAGSAIALFGSPASSSDTGPATSPATTQSAAANQSDTQDDSKDPAGDETSTGQDAKGTGGGDIKAAPVARRGELRRGTQPAATSTASATSETSASASQTETRDSPPVIAKPIDDIRSPFD